MDPLVVGVEETGVAEVVEATKGEIIETMPGAYLFAFLKKTFSSERGRPREDLTFSQLTSSPCAYVSAMAPSAPRFTERPFIRRIGSSGVSKACKFLQIIIWHLHSFLGPQPDENAREHAASQLEDLLDRNPVCFQQVNCGHKRIIVWLHR
jgi:hypothetical protein